VLRPGLSPERPDRDNFLYDTSPARSKFVHDVTDRLEFAHDVPSERFIIREDSTGFLQHDYDFENDTVSSSLRPRLSQESSSPGTAEGDAEMSEDVRTVSDTGAVDGGSSKADRVSDDLGKADEDDEGFRHARDGSEETDRDTGSFDVNSSDKFSDEYGRVTDNRSDEFSQAVDKDDVVHGVDELGPADGDVADVEDMLSSCCLPANSPSPLLSSPSHTLATTNDADDNEGGGHYIFNIDFCSFRRRCGRHQSSSLLMLMLLLLLLLLLWWWWCRCYCCCC
jgi:hypothetical protein